MSQLGQNVWAQQVRWIYLSKTNKMQRYTMVFITKNGLHV